jgi:hypothetical protein
VAEQLIRANLNQQKQTPHQNTNLTVRLLAARLISNHENQTSPEGIQWSQEPRKADSQSPRVAVSMTDTCGIPASKFCYHHLRQSKQKLIHSLSCPIPLCTLPFNPLVGLSGSFQPLVKLQLFDSQFHIRKLLH